MNRQYILTERAHFMCPGMHFGIRCTLRAAYDAQALDRALEALAKVHPFLRALVQYEGDTERLFYAVTDESKIRHAALADAAAVRAAWEGLAAARWNVLEEGLLWVYSCPAPEGTEVLLAAHHLLTDGRGLLGLACELADCYAGGATPPVAEERLIASQGDLPKGSELGLVSRALVDRAGRQWAREGRRVSYEQYLAFAEDYGRAHAVDYRTDTLAPDELARIHDQCRERGLSVNDWLMAQVCLRAGARKLILAVDIRKELPFYVPGALGNYATALGVACRVRSADALTAAAEVHAAVRKALADPRRRMLVLACYLRMEPTLLDAAAISALGGFESKAARFVGGGMFGFQKPASYSVTNLGQVENAHLAAAEFLPPASPAALATLGVLTVNGTMRIVTSVRRA